MSPPTPQPRIAFIGSGNMATALVKGLISQGTAPHHITIASPRIDRQHPLCQQYPVSATQNNVQATEQADIVVLAVKPQILQTVACGLHQIVQQRKPLIISLAAGIRTNTLAGWLGKDIPIVRSMPNLPVTLQSGMTGLYADPTVAPALRHQAESLLSAVGVILWAEREEMLDAITAVSGSGPGYVFLMQEAMEAAAQQLSIDAESARLLTIQTFLGAAQMAAADTRSPADLCARVCSPGGTTEAGIQVFKHKQIKTIFSEAIHSAFQRSLTLAQ
ncbi:MAG: pyrroline-5-carboxylate reductase [Pseudomonadota bacterium]